jgi:hypothetical protein
VAFARIANVLAFVWWLDISIKEIDRTIKKKVVPINVVNGETNDLKEVLDKE